VIPFHKNIRGTNPKLACPPLVAPLVKPLILLVFWRVKTKRDKRVGLSLLRVLSFLRIRLRFPIPALDRQIPKPLSALLERNNAQRVLRAFEGLERYALIVGHLHDVNGGHCAVGEFRLDCTRHGIRKEDVEQLALEKIQEVVAFARRDKIKFTELVQKATKTDGEKAIRSKTAELSKADRRIAELDRIIKKVYEDNVNGKLSDERFAKMLSDYESEQASLVSGTETLRSELESIQSKTTDVQSFINIVERCAEITELTADVARTFIDRIVVHEAVLYPNPKRKEHQSRSQEVHIFLNFIGEFNPN